MDAKGLRLFFKGIYKEQQRQTSVQKTGGRVKPEQQKAHSLFLNWNGSAGGNPKNEFRLAAKNCIRCFTHTGFSNSCLKKIVINMV